MTFRCPVKQLLLSLFFLGLLASGTSRYRYERPSRVVEIKQGRLQGTLVEVPLATSFATAPASDKNQVKKFISTKFNYLGIKLDDENQSEATANFKIRFPPRTRLSAA